MGIPTLANRAHAMKNGSSHRCHKLISYIITYRMLPLMKSGTDDRWLVGEAHRFRSRDL